MLPTVCDACIQYLLPWLSASLNVVVHFNHLVCGHCFVVSEHGALCVVQTELRVMANYYSFNLSDHLPPPPFAH